jgi:uncharacterized protein (TIGR02996 family)
MNEEAAILAAIAAHPAEDTPRLAYADWLDDHAGYSADPPAARLRAEFIRVQCEIKTLEDRTSTELQGYADLYRRQDAILTHHRRELIGPLGDDLTDQEVVFDRGFVAELRLDATRYMRHASEIAAFLPLPEIRVWDGGAWLTHLLEPPGRLELVTVLDMQSPRRLGPTTLGSLLIQWFNEASPRLRLHTLNLEDCLIGFEGLPALVQHNPFPTLTHLDLSGNDLPDASVVELVNSALWPRLKYLVLGANPISNEGAFALADAPPTALEYLNLKFTAIGREGQQRLLRRKGWKVDLF